MKRILITRPLHATKETIRKLTSIGHKPIVLPLSTIISLNHLILPTMNKIHAVLVTSANAITHTSSDVLYPLFTIPLYAVGKTTAQKATEAGFIKVHTSNGDASSLATFICKNVSPKQNIMYLCGKKRTIYFEETLKSSGYKISILETYDTLEINYTDHDLMNKIGETPIDGILLYSLGAAKTLMKILKRPIAKNLFKKASFYCLSEKIGQYLNLPNNKIYIAEQPNEDTLLSLLKENNP